MIRMQIKPQGTAERSNRTKTKREGGKVMGKKEEKAKKTEGFNFFFLVKRVVRVCSCCCRATRVNTHTPTLSPLWLHCLRAWTRFRE